MRIFKYNVESEVGYPPFPNVFSGFNGLIASAACGSVSATKILTCQYNPTNGIGLANTSLALFGNCLFALGEADLPYIIKLTSNEDIEIGHHDFDDGIKQLNVPVFSMTQPSFLHDFAITKKYVIFANIQIGMNLVGMLSGGSPMGSDPSKVSKIVILPRYAKDEFEIKWFNVLRI